MYLLGLLLVLRPGKSYWQRYRALASINPLLLFVLHSTAECVVEPGKPIISLIQDGSEVTHPVVFGINETASIWCRAVNTGAMRALFWRFGNSTRVNKTESGNQEVYVEKFAGSSQSEYIPTWQRVLHFNRTKASLAGNYTCTANLAGNFTDQTVEVQISSEWHTV